MKIEDIIKCINDCIDTERSYKEIKASGILVLQKKKVPNKKFKVYKTYTYTLWDCILEDNIKKAIIEVSVEDKAPENNDTHIVKEVEYKFMSELFKFIQSKSFKDIVDDYGRATKL